jgi:hypothetical protein
MDESCSIVGRSQPSVHPFAYLISKITYWILKKFGTEGLYLHILGQFLVLSISICYSPYFKDCTLKQI